MRELQSEIIVLGGGVGGYAAALTAAKAGRQVILSEETNWIGGQLTSQAVPPDEHAWIEQFGCTQSYRDFRNRVRSYYRRNYPLTPDAQKQAHLNPGNGWVSQLCIEPKVALAVLYEMLAPYTHSGRLQILLHHKPTSAEVHGDVVQSVTLKDLRSGDQVVVTGKVFVDATEMGDLLPMTGTEYVTGAESQQETGELHAPSGSAQPLNMQAVSYCFALDYLPNEDHTIAKPATYDFWQNYVPDLSPPWPGKLLDFTHPFPPTLEPWTRTLFEGTNKRPLWDFRRIIDKANFLPDTYSSDITLVNYPQIDYFLGPVFEVSEAEAARHLEGAKQLSLSFLYWLQTQAPRLDGGHGYPGLRLRKDVVDTDDGLAKFVYVRESRRIRAQFTVLEGHVGHEMRRGEKAEHFFDSVGIGHYNIDLHPSTGGDNYIDVPAMPFQIPLGALLPVRIKNLLPASKNIGTTHITNGCYRLHPVEWNIGEAVGTLAAFSLDHKIDPETVRSQQYLTDYQKRLTYSGIELEWVDVVQTTRDKVARDKLPIG